MAEQHQTRGRVVLRGAVLVVGLCVLAVAMPAEWGERIAAVFSTEHTAQAHAFSDETAELDRRLTEGTATRAPSTELVALVVARRLTRAGALTPEEVEEAADLWLRSRSDPQVAQLLAQRFQRLDEAKVRAELDLLASQLLSTGPGSAPGGECSTCHTQTVPLPPGKQFDVRGIYPFAATAAELRDGRRVPVLAEALETKADCETCHAPHGAPGFEVTLRERVANMGLWVTVEPSDGGVLHVRVKVKNNESGHRAPGGRVAPAYVVTVQARQRHEPLSLRFGRKLPLQLRRAESEAGVAFARDFRDVSGQPSSEPKSIADLVNDSRLESGRFQQLDFLFDRIDASNAQIEVTLWHLPDVTTWEGAQAIRRAFKPERPR